MVAQASAASTSDISSATTSSVEGSTLPPPATQTSSVPGADAAGRNDAESATAPGSLPQSNSPIVAQPPQATKPAPILTAPPVAFPASAARNAPLSSSSIPDSAISSRTSVRSPSPSRRQAFAARELDPLLANLSPMATLEALKASDAVDKQASSQHRELAESIAHVSPAERALGIRAAVAGKKLREWFAEVESWEKEWKGFAMPGAEDDTDNETSDRDPNGRDGAMSRKSNRTGKAIGSVVYESTHDVEYWGSLPAATVVDHEERLDEIQDEMEALELEELKSYVRKAHLLSRDRKNPPSPLNSVQDAAKQSPNHRPSSSYTKLDDFTVVITATIMQSLPHLSRLSSLIELWQTRLLVLRRVPRFLHLLYGAQTSMLEAVSAIDDGRRDPPFSRNEFYTTRDILRAKNNVLGEMLDSMLDTLDGREDTVPEDWIEGMEGLERGYSEWVADAEDTVMNNILGVRRVGRADDDEGEKKRLTAIQETETEAEAEAADEEPTMMTGFGPAAKAHTGAAETMSLTSAALRSDQSGLGIARDSGMSLLIPRIDEPGAKGRLATLVKTTEAADPGSAGGISLSSDMSEAEAARYRESLHNRHFSATYSTITASPEINTADAVEYFNVTSQGAEEEAAPALRPALLEVSSRKTSGQKSRSVSGERERSPSSLDHVERASPASQRLDLQSQQGLRPISMVSQLTAVRRHSSRSDQGPLAEGFEPTIDMDDLQHSPSPATDSEGSMGRSADEAFHQSEFQRFEEEAGDADVEDAEVTDSATEYQSESAYAGYTHRRNQSLPWPRKSSSDETRARSFHTRSSSGMQPNGRSRASTLNTYETWSDHEDSEQEGEGDVNGGLRSYRRMKLPPVQERSRSRPRSKILQAQVDPSFSYDDMFDSLVQSFSPPASPTRELEELRPLSRQFADDESVRVDLSRRPSISALSLLREDEESGRNRVDFTRRPSIPALSLPLTDTQSRSSTSLGHRSGRTSVDHSKRPSVSGISTRRSGELLRDLLPHSRQASISRAQIDRTMIEAPQSGRATKTKPARQVPEPLRLVSRSTNQNRNNAVVDDPFTAQISTLLSRIPVPIRLTSGLEAPDSGFSGSFSPPSHSQSPPGSPVMDPRTPLSSNPPETFERALALTLAPAPSPGPTKQSTPAGPRSAPSETKLYHLHQPGRAQPIKLLVRLVGENGDRVMVRVGGGWSDLEEYLKEYALHHGRSATLGGEGITNGEGSGIEVRPFEDRKYPSPWSNGNASRGGSQTSLALVSDRGAGGQISRSASPALVAPFASVPVHSKDYVSRARRHVSSGGYLGKPSHSPGNATGNPYSSPPTSPLAFQYSPANSETFGYSATVWAGTSNSPAPPPARSPSISSRIRRPSTGSLVSNLTHARNWSVFRPLTPSGQRNETPRSGSEPLGPAGPVSLGKEISPRKKAWVEGVMKQARRVSGTGRKSSAGGLSFGTEIYDDGKENRSEKEVSGTKRVFLRRTSLRGKAGWG